MTENAIKELISKNYIRIIANRQGYKVSIPDPDNGVDFHIIEVAKFKDINGSVRYLDSGKLLHLQLKCTTDKGVTYTENTIKFTLESKTYNDLIYRRKNTNPLILIIFILPSEMERWVFYDENMLRIERHAFWYIPSETEKETENVSSITIEIDKTNLITQESFKKLFGIIYS